MRKISPVALAMLATAATALTGCFASGAEEAPKQTTETSQTLPITANQGPGGQDFWVYHQIQTVAPDGEVVDLTEHILSGLGDPSRSEQMPDGASFHIYDALTPSVTNAGTARSDLSVVAGVFETNTVRALAALATPLADASESIGPHDAVELDLTYLGDLLTPGDPLVADVVFIQTRPGEGEAKAAEAGLDDVALLTERLTNGRAFTYGGQTDDGPLMFPMTNVLGAAVAGSTRMSVPGKGGLPGPDLSKPMGELVCPRDALGCIENYFESMIEVAEDAKRLLDCNFSGCLEPPAPPPPDLCIGLDCPPPSVRADPHILSLDGATLSMQGVGEYVVSRGTGVEIQMRTVAAGAHRTASAVTMVAVQVGEDVAVTANDTGDGEMGVWINDEVLPYDPAHGYLQQSQRAGFSVTLTPYEVLLEASDGSKFYVRRALSSFLDLSLQLTDEVTGLTGLLGDGDGNPDNDWRARDGSLLTPDSTGRVLYTGFSDTWRVTQAESILRYLPGESTETFTDMPYPEHIITLEDLDHEQRAQAEALCRLAGVIDDILLDQCVLDYILTGDIAFVLSAQYAERGFEAYATHTASGNADSGTSAWALAASSERAPGAEVFSHVCPPKGVEHAVWGGANGVYTADSSICTAAVHAGLITVERGGTVEVTRLAGLDNYGAGSTHNGITTRDWQRSWPESFSLDG